MNMDEYVEMWKNVSEGKEVGIPAQLHIRGQMRDIASVFGSEQGAYEYFKKVKDAEAPIVK